MLSEDPEAGRKSSEDNALDIVNFARRIREVILELILCLSNLKILILIELLLHLPDLFGCLLEFVLRMSAHLFILDDNFLAIFRKAQNTIELEVIHKLFIKGVVEFGALNRFFSQRFQ